MLVVVQSEIVPFEHQPLSSNVQLGSASGPRCPESSLGFVLRMPPASSDAVENMATSASGGTTPNFWTPIPLRRWTLAAFIVHFVVLIITFAVLFVISNWNQGLATANLSWYYLWVYGPTTVFTLLAAFWAPVEYRVKQMAPWVAMVGTFRSADEGLLVDYIDRISFTGLLVSIRRRHWLVCLGIAASFIIQGATVASSGLFSSSSVVIRREGAQLMADEAFSVEKLVPTGPGPATDIYAVLTSNLSYPAGTTGPFAFQRFSTPNRMLNPTVRLHEFN